MWVLPPLKHLPRLRQPPFKDSQGNYIYGFCADNLAATVQDAVDSAKNAGADYVIVVGHLGKDYVKSGWSSTDIIQNTTDIDAFIANINNQYAAEFDEVVGTTDFPLVSTDAAENEIVRYQETNLGDFIADAMRESLDAEVAFINSGGVRSNLDAGDITKAD